MKKKEDILITICEKLENTLAKAQDRSNFLIDDNSFDYEYGSIKGTHGGTFVAFRDDGYEIDDIITKPPYWITDNSSAYKAGMTVHTDFKALEKDIRAYIEDELTELSCTYADEEQNMDFEGTISLHIEFTKTDEELIISGIWKQDE